MKNSSVRNIWAVGRNYARHAQEMKADIPQEPFFFLKSGACLSIDPQIALPAWSNDVHHELEIALRLDENLNFSHLTLALDLTARDAQNVAKKQGLPWTLAKSFSGSCPIGNWISLSEIASFDSLGFVLLINKQAVQNGATSDMIFKPAALLEYARTRFPLEPGDIILSGTPEGVGPLKKGDRLQALLQSEKREILACHWDVI